MHLVPRKPQSRNYISCGVSLREHVFYLFAGGDIPFRHLMFTHDIFKFLRQPLTLSHRLHDFEGVCRRQSAMQEIQHYGVTGTDDRVDRTDALFYQRFAVIEPDTGTV